MRHFLTVLLLLCCGQCLSQVSYIEALSLRLQEIRKLDFYDNNVIFTIDSIDYHDLSFPYWNPNEIYYQDDITRYQHCQYAALKNTKGQRPDTARTAWTLVLGPHPALFLRDTARTEDLITLLLDKHVYVKMYAFAALSFRKEKNLFPIIVENLKDATQILEYTGDHGNSAYPADLMIQYEIDRLSDSEKEKLEELIGQKYPHITRGLATLSGK